MLESDRKIIIRKRLIKNPAEEIDDPAELNLLFAQAVDDFLKDVFSVKKSQSIQLAAIRAQIVLGDMDGIPLANKP